MELPKDPLESFRKRNPHLYPGAVALKPHTANAAPGSFSLVGFSLTISGQIRGGKNNIIITRTGRRFPNHAWAVWRDEKVSEVKRQLPKNFQAISVPVNVRIEYVSGDHRRRDNPAIVDSIWHVLEKAGVVTDDTFLWPAQSSRGFNKDFPRAVITFL